MIADAVSGFHVARDQSHLLIAFGGPGVMWTLTGGGGRNGGTKGVEAVNEVESPGLDSPSGRSHTPFPSPPASPPALAAQQSHCEEEPVPFPRRPRAQNLLAGTPHPQGKTRDALEILLRILDTHVPAPLLLGCGSKT